MVDGAPQPSRRRVLAGLGATAASSLAGCMEGVWSRAEPTPSENVSLSVKMVPTADDVVAAKIANQLIENLRAVGIDATPEPMASAELYRDVLLDREFDVFVARHPGFDEFDALRPLLHSDFVSERGWQNPFSFSDPTVDDLLDEQLTDRGYGRLAAFSDLFEYLLDTAPFTAVAFPDRLGAAGGLDGVSSPPGRPVEYVDLLADPPEDVHDAGRLRVGLPAGESFDRLNPIAVGADDGLVLDLLYDPLVRVVDDDPVPWLAETVDWRRRDGRLEATVALREGLRWHDGESLDADDVAFTVEFLGDTSLGGHESGVPAPRYRGRQTLVDDVTAVDARTVRFRFRVSSPAVASRSLTIPLLPRHVWESRSELVDDHRTWAITWANETPVGSGLLAFGGRTGDAIVLEPFDDHVLRGEADVHPSLDGFPGYDSLAFVTAPNAGASIESLRTGDVDLVAGALPPEAFADLDDETVSPVSGPTGSFYMIGYNLRHPELGNHRFRSIVSRLVDRGHVVDAFADGHARPANTRSAVVGVDPDDWEYPQPADLATFPGTDGAVDVERVRSLFEDAGYRYDDDENALLV